LALRGKGLPVESISSFDQSEVEGWFVLSVAGPPSTTGLNRRCLRSEDLGDPPSTGGRRCLSRSLVPVPVLVPLALAPGWGWWGPCWTRSLRHGGGVATEPPGVVATGSVGVEEDPRSPAPLEEAGEDEDKEEAAACTALLRLLWVLLLLKLEAGRIQLPVLGSPSPAVVFH